MCPLGQIYYQYMTLTSEISGLWNCIYNCTSYILQSNNISVCILVMKETAYSKFLHLYNMSCQMVDASLMMVFKLFL